MLDSGQGLPKGVDFNNKFIYYVGPVAAVNGEVIGPWRSTMTLTGVWILSTTLFSALGNKETYGVMKTFNDPIGC
jgi:fumarate hydratase class I